MELKFRKQRCAYLDTPVQEVQNLEQSQEIRLPEGMPDIGRVLSAWGQPLLRGKEWREEGISASGGMTVWMLYAPEDGTEPRCMESWMPFQLNWNLPDHTPEGKIRVSVQPRFVDARSVSARKVMVRAGAAAMAEAFSPREAEVYMPEAVPPDVQILRSSYPMHLPVEAGERSFFLDEELTVPGSLAQPQKLMYYTLRPEITDRKVLGDKVVFRGNGNLHILYRTEDGKLQSWDFALPFSQFGELETGHSSDAQADVILCPTSLELELDEGGHLRLKCGIVGQYLVTDRQLIELVEDAYSPDREVTIRQETLQLPAVLETRRENLFGEQKIPTEGREPVDVQYMPAFPRVVRDAQGVWLEAPGLMQVLYYGEDGALRSATGRWEGRQHLPADENDRIGATSLAAQEPQLIPGSDGITAKLDLPLQVTTTAGKGISMVTGLELGDEKEPDPTRPSLILCRAGNLCLWELAKTCGSTVDAIRGANCLEDVPTPEQMLLIPIN